MLNQNPTSFREVTHTRVTVTVVLPSGAGFGVTHETQEGVYLPAVALAGSGAALGDVLEASLVPNTRGDARSPWFATRVLLGANSAITPGAVLEVLRDTGGAWTPEDMAECLLDRDPGDVDTLSAQAALEAVYRGGHGVAKALLFTAPDCNAAKSWYTLTPGTCDFAEYDE